MYCFIIIIIISLLYYYILKKYGNKKIKKSDTKSIESIESIKNKIIKNNIDLELHHPPSYEEVMKDTKRLKYKLCPNFKTFID